MKMNLDILNVRNVKKVTIGIKKLDHAQENVMNLTNFVHDAMIKNVMNAQEDI